MAKSRRNSGGCTRGRYKRKKMGKGYATARKVPVVPRVKPAAEAGAEGEPSKPAKS